MGEYIDFDGTFNFRDIGGFRTADGRSVKKGLLFRSDALYKLSERDLSRLVQMNIRTVVDFRSPSEAASQPNRLPDGIDSVTLSPMAIIAEQASASVKRGDQEKIDRMEKEVQTEEGKQRMLSNLDAMEGQMRLFVTSDSGIHAYSSLLGMLLRSDTAPVVFHCKGGKDRTGWAAALILSVLGVSRDDVIADYMSTEQYNKERNEKRMNQYRELTNNEYILAFLSSLMQVKEQYIAEKTGL